MGAQKLNDRLKKRIIADYSETQNFSATARRFGVSHYIVKKIVMEQPIEFEKLLNQKKEQNTADVLAHMDGKKDMVCRIIDKYLNALETEEKINAATLSQITTALGTLIDKWTSAAATQQSQADAGDDPLTIALKESVKNGTVE